MPKSRVRKKPVYTPPTASPQQLRKKRHGKPWIGPAMTTCFLIGIVWLVVFYITNGEFPVPDVRNWNMAIGFGFLCVGFGLSTQWR